MAHAHAQPKRLTSVFALIPIVMMSVFLTWTLPRSNADAAVLTTMSHGHQADLSKPAQQTFHDQMRKLWEDHATWTRLAIVTFADGSPSFSATADRLLRNQVDIGNAIKPYFGAAAGTQLTALLHDHITIAVEILQAAKAGDTAAFTEANTRWYANGNDIADFLSKANPRYWPSSMTRPDMKTHLDQTLAEAAHELGGDYVASVADYDEVHAHLLVMGDMLSDGIVAKFPSRFH
ncbi:MAG: hypothetical protein ABIZ07_13685 [Dermatophilaceae bacterium]